MVSLLAVLASMLSWPEPHEESMVYCQEEDRPTRPGNVDDLKQPGHVPP